MQVTPVDERPIVSAVMATYNRSNLLPYVIGSVRRQTWTDWELLVVGDACTDDTASVVAAFGDDRIRFWNLASACGEQSGPNNAGSAEARGRYIAFLNHDDFWTPRHLERCVAALEANPAIDLVFGLNIALQHDGQFVVWGPVTDGPPQRRRHATTLPETGVPASGWVFRRGLVDRVGPWTPAAELHQVPSQDWLRRAAAVAKMQMLPFFSVLSIPSNRRARSYADRAAEEHAAWFRRMTDEPEWAEDLLVRVLCDRELSSWKSGNSRTVAPFLRRAIKNAGKRCLSAAGISPVSAAMWLRYRRRGGFIAHARRVRGI